MALQRDNKLDLIRGIAAFLVISGHTFQVYGGYADNPLYNFITAIQMPLFMMVSGYAIGFSSPIGGGISFCRFLKRRTLSLMLPWLVWSILAYLILSGAPVIDYIKTTAFHMEAAFWFLFSLWNIHLIFALSSLICYKLKGNIRIISILILCGVFDAFLMLVGLKLGMTFLGIKYTTYYLVFYLIGWILNLYITKHPEWSNKTWSGIAFMTFTVLFEVMLSKYSIVSMPDTSKWIALRFLVSLAGCLAVFYFVYNYTIKSEIFSS